MDQLWEIIKPIVGGGGLLALFWYIVNKIVDNRFEKKVREYESSLQVKIASTQIQFEKEYKIYGELWGALSVMVSDAKLLFPIFESLPKNLEERQKVFLERYHKSANSYNEFLKTLGENEPFIDEGVIKKLTEIRKSCFKQLITFETYRFHIDDDRKTEEKLEDFKFIDEINEQVEKVTQDLRQLLRNNKIS